MTDAYYELRDAADLIGERFSASDHVLGNWGPNMQSPAPVSALLVRSLERCAPRTDARLSRVVVDLLGAVPAGDQVWMRARVDRAGAKIELLSAEMLAPGPSGAPRPVANESAWRFGDFDSGDLAFAPEPPASGPGRGASIPLRRIPWAQLPAQPGLAVAQ